MNNTEQNEQKAVKITLTVADLKHQPGMAVQQTEVKGGKSFSLYKSRGVGKLSSTPELNQG